MTVKLLVLFAVATIAVAAPRSRNDYYDYLFRRGASFGGCSREELQSLAASGVDLVLSDIDCGNDMNDLTQMDETVERKRGCSIDYSASPACCSPGCNWIMELHCMSPVQMICS